jgi:hypothetical protein
MLRLAVPGPRKRNTAAIALNLPRITENVKLEARFINGSVVFEPTNPPQP